MKMEGLKLKRWGVVKNGAFDVIPNYRRVGFNLNDSGGQGGKFNEPWEAQCRVLVHSFGFRWWWRGWSCALGAICASHAALPVGFHALGMGMH